MAVICCERPVLPERDAQASRSGETVEGAWRRGPVRQRHRVIPVVFEPAADLEGRTLEVQLLERKEREGVLQGRGRESFLSRGRVVTMQAPEAEGAGPASLLPFVEHPSIGEGLVLEKGVHLVCEGVDLSVLVVVVLQRELSRVDEPLAVAKTSVQPDAMPARVEEHDLRFLFCGIEGNTVVSLVKSVIGTEETALGVIPESARAVAGSRIRVGDPSDRRVVVPRSLASAVAPDQPLLGPVLDTPAPPSLVIVRAGDTRDIAVRARMRRVVPRDPVDYAADGIVAVEQRGRASDDFQFFEIHDIHRLRVISRLKAEGPDTISVLQDEHAVPVEAAQDGPRR